MVNHSQTKVALVLAFCAFQLHTLTMTSTRYGLFSSKGNKEKDRNNVIQAFIIIAYGCFIVGLVLSFAMSYCGMANSRLLAVFGATALIFAACSVVIGVAVYDNQVAPSYSSYTTTTFVTAAAAGLSSAIFLFLSLCC